MYPYQFFSDETLLPKAMQGQAPSLHGGSAECGLLGFVPLKAVEEERAKAAVN